MTAEELGERMSVAELFEWSERDRVHHSDAWQQTALLCATIVNAVGSAVSKDHVPVPVSQFLPDRTGKAEVAGPDPDLMVKLLAWASAHNARVGTDAQEPQ